MVSGMHGTFALERAHVMDIKSFEAHTPPHYDLVLEDVDELFYLIFNVTRMNPNFYLGGLHPSAINVLNDKNLHPFPPAP